jgi:hypothetical protein
MSHPQHSVAVPGAPTWQPTGEPSSTSWIFTAASCQEGRSMNFYNINIKVFMNSIEHF